MQKDDNTEDAEEQSEDISSSHVEHFEDVSSSQVSSHQPAVKVIDPRPPAKAANVKVMDSRPSEKAANVKVIDSRPKSAPGMGSSNQIDRVPRKSRQEEAAGFSKMVISRALPRPLYSTNNDSEPGVFKKLLDSSNPDKSGKRRVTSWKRGSFFGMYCEKPLSSATQSAVANVRKPSTELSSASSPDLRRGGPSEGDSLTSTAKTLKPADSEGVYVISEGMLDSISMPMAVAESRAASPEKSPIKSRSESRLPKQRKAGKNHNWFDRHHIMSSMSNPVMNKRLRCYFDRPLELRDNVRQGFTDNDYLDKLLDPEPPPWGGRGEFARGPSYVLSADSFDIRGNTAPWDRALLSQGSQFSAKEGNVPWNDNWHVGRCLACPRMFCNSRCTCDSYPQSSPKSLSGFL